MRRQSSKDLFGSKFVPIEGVQRLQNSRHTGGRGAFARRRTRSLASTQPPLPASSGARARLEAARSSLQAAFLHDFTANPQADSCGRETGGALRRELEPCVKRVPSLQSNLAASREAKKRTCVAPFCTSSLAACASTHAEGRALARFSPQMLALRRALSLRLCK